VTGKDIGTVLAEEILDPLGFRWTNYGVALEHVSQVALSYVTGPPTALPSHSCSRGGSGSRSTS
jgi:CubicO group peptidase (beta-lactamase class C family)